MRLTDARQLDALPEGSRIYAADSREVAKYAPLTILHPGTPEGDGDA